MICLFCIVVAIALLIVLFVVVSLLYLYCYLVVLRCADMVWLELVVCGLMVGCCVALVLVVCWFLIALLDGLSFWFLVWVWLFIACFLFTV